MEKLAQSSMVELDQSRPLAADMLIHQAMAICEERSDDKCRAEAAKRYGQFLNSDGFYNERWVAPYTRGAGRFLDNTVTLENHRQKGIESFMRARDLFVKLKIYDEIINVDFFLGNSYWHLQDQPQACLWYSRSVDDYKILMANDPKMPMHIPKEFLTFPDYVASLKTRLKCVE